MNSDENSIFIISEILHGELPNYFTSTKSYVGVRRDIKKDGVA